MDHSADNLFVNTQLLVGPNGTAACVYSDTRSDPLLENSANYELAVARLSIMGCTSMLPLFQAQIMTGQSNVNLTPYIVTMTGQLANAAPAIVIGATNNSFNTSFYAMIAGVHTQLSQTVVIPAASYTVAT